MSTPADASQLASDVAAMVALLDATEALPEAAPLRRHSYELLHAQRGRTVVDVGAGTGRAVAELTRAGVGAIGIDPSDMMLDIARCRYPDIDLRTGTAEALPLRDGTLPGTVPTRCSITCQTP
jgi:ubiquinone/menaquinone biosynthesis C-methylase UbiE